MDNQSPGIGFAAWVVWSLLQRRYVFQIRIAGGQPSVRKGKVTAAFPDRVAEVCQESGVARGGLGASLAGGGWRCGSRAISWLCAAAVTKRVDVGAEGCPSS